MWWRRSPTRWRTCTPRESRTSTSRAPIFSSTSRIPGSPDASSPTSVWQWGSHARSSHLPIVGQRGPLLYMVVEVLARQVRCRRHADGEREGGRPLFGVLMWEMPYENLRKEEIVECCCLRVALYILVLQEDTSAIVC